MIKFLKCILPILFILIVLIAVPINSSAAYAEEDKTEENLESAVGDALNNLDLTAYEEFLATLKDYNDVSFSGSVRSLISAVLNGENDIDFTYFLKFISQAILGEVVNLLPQMLIIVVIVLLYGVLQNLTHGFAKADVQKIVYLACYGLVLAVIGYLTTKSILASVRAFELITKFTDGCFPVLITLVAALGGKVGTTVYQPMVMIFGTVMMKLITIIIMPLFYITFVFGLVGNLSDNLRLDKFSQTTKSAAQWILGITFSLFITLLTSQGITGASFDGLAARGAKYMLSSYVPIVGNYLKDGFDIVMAGCVVLKNALGLCSVIIILFAVLIPLIRIIILSLGLKLTAAVLEPVSDSKFSSALFTAADSMKILIIAILCAASAVIIMLMMIIYTCNFGAL